MHTWGTITITWRKKGDDATKLLDKRNKEVIFKNYAPFTDSLIEIKNGQIDNAKDLDFMISKYNLI